MAVVQARSAAPAAARAIEMIWGFMASQALYVAAKLTVFDSLQDGPKTAREMAEGLDAAELPLRRLLRYLTAIDVLAEDERGRFSSTALGELFRSDHPRSLRSLVLFYGESFCWQAWSDLYGAVKTGQPAFQRVHGEPFFDYLGRHPSDAAVFNAAMTSVSNVDVPAIIGAYDFSAFEKVVDVAGGHGALLGAILERCPKTLGVLSDLASVVSGANTLRDSAVAARCQFVAADFFASVPSGGDAYVLKRILHDWNDDESIRILQNCRQAIVPGGKLLVIEQVVEPPNRPDPAKWMDLNMLVLLTGRERTEAEFAELYARAGFRLTRVVPAGRLSIVEGAPA